jgi:predicted nuclease of restriction endonuclease-like (RecB) superfamily
VTIRILFTEVSSPLLREARKRHKAGQLTRAGWPQSRLTVQHGWSRNVLVHQIEAERMNRQGKAVANFERTLPPPQSDLAQDITKDPYNFDFLTLGDDARERDLERGLLDHLRRFLLELGVGFAFVGSQYRLPVGTRTSLSTFSFII